MSAKALFEPMLCETAERLPEGSEWRYELKLDGYRAIGFKTYGRAQLWSRNGKDFVRRFPEVAKAVAYLPEETAVDGELVALDAEGTSFPDIARALSISHRRAIRCCERVFQKVPPADVHRYRNLHLEEMQRIRTLLWKT